MPEKCKISIIIPSFGDLELACRNCELLNPDGYFECIIVEAGSARPETITENYQLIHSEVTSRASQLNLGASKATGSVLCFLHADTHLNRKDLIKAAELLDGESARFWGGTFRFKLASTKISARIVELGAQLREIMTGLAFGDQGICVLREKFFELKGFPNIPILEDLFL
ncbi:MAG: glycosyltransferase [Bdellovibrionota bacterium]